VNKANVNQPRGMHEYIVVNRTALVNVMVNCPDARPGKTVNRPRNGQQQQFDNGLGHKRRH
jgi:hypothetical protein